MNIRHYFSIISHLRTEVCTAMAPMLLLLFTVNVDAQRIAVNTDVLMDACLAPSIGVELTLAKKSTLNINGLYGRKILGKEMRIAALQPEWRVYISGRPMYHHYIGVIGLLSSYKLDFDNKCHDGDACGLGVSFGYVLPLKDRLLIDFHSSLGGAYYHQKEYMIGDDYDKTHVNYAGYPVANASGGLLIPLRMGVSVTYIIK